MAMLINDVLDLDYQNDDSIQTEDEDNSNNSNNDNDDRMNSNIEKSIWRFEKTIRKKFRRSIDEKLLKIKHHNSGDENINMTVTKLKENIRLLEKTNHLISAQIRKRRKRYLNNSGNNGGAVGIGIEKTNYQPTNDYMKNQTQHDTLSSSSTKPAHTINTASVNNNINNLPSFLPYVRWCGNHEANMSIYDFISDNNEALLHFHSDFSLTGTGFSATWTAVDISGCPLQTLTAREGYLTSPNYPHFLLNNLECTFIIQAPQGKKVWLEIIDYELIDDSALYIDLGGDAGELKPFHLFNQLNDGVFLSKNERMKVRIKTGQYPKGKGFKGIYKTSKLFVIFIRIYFSLWLGLFI